MKKLLIGICFSISIATQAQLEIPIGNLPSVGNGGGNYNLAVKSVSSLHLDSTGTTNVSTSIQALLDNATVRVIEFDGIGGSQWKASINIPAGKVVRFQPGNK